MTENSSSGVGYRRPPEHTRFQPGQSGNPRGRPRGARSLADIVRKIIGQKVTITENGRTRRVSKIELIVMRMAAEASRGEPRAQRHILQLSERFGGEQPGDVPDKDALSAEDAEILRRYLATPIDGEG